MATGVVIGDAEMIGLLGDGLLGGGVGAAPLAEVGESLVEHCRALGRGEAAWLEALARFDREGGWALDGQLSCAGWLVWRAGLARTTAYEKLRVAQQMALRPVLAEALRSGRASYCALRAMARAEGASPEVDEAFVVVAEVGTVSDVERAVAAYLAYRSQDHEPPERALRRGVRTRSVGDGMSRVVAVLTDVEAAELEAALRHGEHPAEGSARADDRSWMDVRADALMEVVRARLGGSAGGADRYMAHVIVRHDGAELRGGAPIDRAELARIMCDCSSVTHVVDHHGAPLALGRRRRQWSSAQRRAVLARDSGRCRWPGCEHTRVDVHHVLGWDDGGRTDVSNGVALCPQHHTKLHRGWHTTGHADATLTFHRPTGTAVGTSGICSMAGPPVTMPGARPGTPSTGGSAS